MESKLAGEKTIGDSISLEILTSGIKLPPIPVNGMKLLNMVQQPIDDIDITSFVKLVEVDPGLFSSVMQLANSPYYKGVEDIINLRSAINRIGLTETINSICLYFFQKALPKLPEIEGFSSNDYWAYSWACAVSNRRLGHPNLQMNSLPGELYMAGLLHGMGKLLFAINYTDQFSECIVKARYMKQPLYKMEQDVFGTTDAFVASRVMEAWHFPVNICSGVAYYQRPESAPDEYKEIAGLTQLAYCIASVSGIGNSGDGLEMDPGDAYICRQSELPVSRGKIRGKLISEIMSSLEKKAESVTGSSPVAKVRTSERQGLKETKQSVGKMHKPEKAGALKIKEKAFFSRVWSFILGRG